jgi:hypothetical protein
VTIGGKEIEYEAKAGTLPILKPDGKPSAQVFYTAYTMKNVKDVTKRPVTFCFNGGTGQQLGVAASGSFRAEAGGSACGRPDAAETAGRAGEQ